MKINYYKDWDTFWFDTHDDFPREIKVPVEVPNERVKEMLKMPLAEVQEIVKRILIDNL